MRDLISQWWRLGGLFGIGFAVLFIVGLLILQIDAVTYDDPIGEIKEYFVDDGDKYLVGDYLIGIGFVFFFFFFFFFFPFPLSLRALLGRVEGGINLYSWLALVGGLTLALMGYASSIAIGALALGAAGDDSVNDSSVQTLVYLDAYGFAGVPLFGALLFFAASVVIYRTGVLWRWLAFLGAAAGVLAVMGAAWPIDGDPEGFLGVVFNIALIGFLLWVLLISIGMVMKKELPAPAAE